MDRLTQSTKFLVILAIFSLLGIKNSWSETLSESTTLMVGDHSYIEDLVIPSGVTLTVEAGAVLRFGESNELLVKNGGKLYVQGTAESPVVFTSEGFAIGSWKGLRFEGSRSTFDELVIENAIIEYADKALYTKTVGTKVDVSHSTVRYNNYGVFVDAAYNAAPNHPAIRFVDGALYENAQYNYFTQFFYGSTLTTIDATGNWWGTSNLAEIQASIFDIQDATYRALIDYSDLLISEGGESLSGTHIMGSVSGEQRWSFTDGVALGDIIVKTNGSLTVEAGTHLSFLGNNKIIVEDGASFNVLGESDNPVTFTSGKASKVAGDWGGIEVASNTNVHISNAVIEYANKGIFFNGLKASGTVTNSIIENNNTGIHVSAAHQSLANHPTPVVTNNVIQNNVNYNYYSELFGSASSRTLNAKGNFWGTTDNTAISQSIYDNSDSSSSPIVDYGFARTSELTAVIADAGFDTIGYGTVETVLAGMGSSNVAITHYSWEQYIGNQVTLNNANTSTANFTVADVQNDELISFIFTVTDVNDISATDKLNVVVKPFSEYNQKPVVDESQEVLVTGGDEVSVTLAASDGDNDPLTYTWQQVSGETITLAATNTDTLAFAAPSNAKNKVVSFKLSVTDGNYTVERTVVVAVKAPETTAGTYYYHNDHLGTPQVMTDVSATVVWQADYTPFGEADIVVETVTNNLRFSGQYWDSESGLHYNYFRDYDPELGRYVQADPRGITLDFSDPQRQVLSIMGIPTAKSNLRSVNHLYNYAHNNPISLVDPTGEFTPIAGAVGGFVAGGFGSFVGTLFAGGSFADASSAAFTGALIGGSAGFIAGFGPLGTVVGIGFDLLANGFAGASIANTALNNEQEICD